MRVHDALNLPSLALARRVGGGELGREVTLAHVVDVPEAPRWVTPGTFLLSTGLSWPRGGAELAALGRELAACQPAAVVLAAPHFFPAFPPEVSAPLAAQGIAALELPYEVPFAQVVQEVHGLILREQAEVLRRSERIHRALTRAALGGSLADVARTLSDGLGRGAVVVAASGAPLTPGPAPRAAATLAALARPGNAPRDLAGGPLVPVVVRGRREGGVWVAPAPEGAPAGAPPELVVRAAEHAATVAGLLLLAQRDAEILEARLGYAFVDTLLEGRVGADAGAYAGADPSAQERAARLGFDPAGAYAVGLLVLPGPLPLSPEGFAGRERAAQRVREVLVSLGAAPLVSVTLNTVWFLLPERLSAERVWARLGWQGQPGAPGGMVYSRTRPAAALPQGRAEALTLAAHVRPGELRSYAEVLVPRALSGDRAAQTDLTLSLLGPLRGARGAGGLLETIRALCETGFSQVETAARLGIHANTLRYRMERIETLTGRPLGAPETRALWWLALQLDALGA